MRKQMKNESIIMYAEYAANYAAELEEELKNLKQKIEDIYLCRLGSYDDELRNLVKQFKDSKETERRE